MTKYIYVDVSDMKYQIANTILTYYTDIESNTSAVVLSADSATTIVVIIRLRALEKIV